MPWVGGDHHSQVIRGSRLGGGGWGDVGYGESTDGGYGESTDGGYQKEDETASHYKAELGSQRPQEK